MTLFFLAGSMYLLRYLGLVNVLVIIITQEPWVYLATAIALLGIRVLMLLYKYIPYLSRFFKSFERVSNNSSAILQRMNGGKPKGSRPFSTQAGEPSLRRGISPSAGGQGITNTKPLPSRDSGPKPTLFFIKDLVSAVRTKTADVNAMSTVKGGAWWVNKVIRLLPAIGLSVTGPRVRAIVVILRKFSRIGRTQGIRGLVIYLKACHVLLTQSCAGHMIKDTGSLGVRISRTNTGMPRVILVQDRVKIRLDNHLIIKFYQTVFGLYRILSFEGKLKLSSITSPFKGNYQFIFGEIIPLIPVFMTALLRKYPAGFPKRSVNVRWVGIKKVETLGSPDFLAELRRRYAELVPIWLARSAIGTKEDLIEVSSHPFLMLQTAATIKASPIWSDFKRFLDLFPVNALFVKAFNAVDLLSVPLKPLPSLGKLGLKEEAAGKVRVFAMVPTWFQNLLKPLHDIIFEILSGVTQDGTFNQMAPLKGHSSKFKMSFSLDLTAATDRLPLIIQTVLMSELIGVELATSWANLLTKIEYSINSMKFNTYERVKYSVGQPMGALSSWAMLALTHHLLVQISAWRVGAEKEGTWFTDYAILGDDLVIFNYDVAHEYIKVIHKIGMEIGLHKSVLSRKFTSLEFAKRIFHRGHDVSAVPFKEFFAALGGYGNILEFARKYNLTILDVAKTLGFKFKALSKINHGFHSLNYKLKQLVVASNLPTSTEAVIPFLEMGSPKHSPWPIAMEEFFANFTMFERKALAKMLSQRQRALMSSLDTFFHNSPTLKDNVLLHSIISDKVKVPVTPRALDWNWAIGPTALQYANVGGSQVLVVLGPAEAKEDWSGFVMAADATISQPIKVSLRHQRDLIPFSERQYLGGNLAIDLSEAQVKEFRQALSYLWDFQILPLRSELMSKHEKLASLLVKDWAPSKELAEAMISFLEVSREAALIPTHPVSFKRIAVSERHSDPVSIRLWKRWSKYLQGTVHTKFGSFPSSLERAAKNTTAHTVIR